MTDTPQQPPSGPAPEHQDQDYPAHEPAAPDASAPGDAQPTAPIPPMNTGGDPSTSSRQPPEPDDFTTYQPPTLQQPYSGLGGPVPWPSQERYRGGQGYPGVRPQGPAALPPYGAAASVPASADGETGPAERPRRERRRRHWLPVVATAAVTAVVVSAGTVAVTGGFDRSTAPAPAASASASAQIGQESDSSVSVPVTASEDSRPDWQSVAAAVAPSVVSIAVRVAQGEAEGSGVVLDAEGHVLTNNHVVAGAEDGKIQVTLSDGRMYRATVVGTDPTTDLAVVKLDSPPDNLKSVVFGNSSDVKVGDPVMAEGNPLGLASTVTTGIISALDRPVSTVQEGSAARERVVTNAIQIDAAINPGNSGGPLFNAQGEVIGITSSIASLSQSSTGQAGSIGLGFAIPADLVSTIGGQLIKDGSAKHAYLGVSLGDGTATADGVTRQGAKVISVSDSSPAAAAGLRKGDVITGIDGKTVTGAESLTGFVREHVSGDVVKLALTRDGKAKTVSATLATKKDDTDATPNDGDQQIQPQNPDQQGDGQDDPFGGMLPFGF